MSVSCTSSPTLTQTSQVVTQSLRITSTDSVTTTPPSTTTVVATSCLPITSGSSCVSTTVTSTIPAVTATVQVPFTLTVSITNDVLNTLFGSSCTTIATGPITTTQPSTTTTSTTSTSSSTPTPIVFTSESTSTQANGSVVVQTMTTTATQSAVSLPTVQHSNNNNDPATSIQIAPIIGGVVGGFFGLVGIVLLIWFILRRRRRWHDVIDHDLALAAGPRRDSRFSLDLDMEPKPYQYGLVGHALAPDPVSPPHSPSLLPVVQTNADARSPQPHHERGRSSPTPLSLSMTTLTPGLSATSTSSRPSTGSSTQPLRSSSQQDLLQQQQQQRLADFGRSTSAAATSQSSHQGTTSFSNRSLSAGYGVGATRGTAVLGEYDDYRSGSPASMVQQSAQRLTITNANSPESGTLPFHDSFSLPAEAVVTTATPKRDGKGRMRTIPPSAPIVHLDGGRVQQMMARHENVDGPLFPRPPSYEA